MNYGKHQNHDIRQYHVKTTLKTTLKNHGEEHFETTLTPAANREKKHIHITNSITASVNNTDFFKYCHALTVLHIINLTSSTEIHVFIN